MYPPFLSRILNPENRFGLFADGDGGGDGGGGGGGGGGGEYKTLAQQERDRADALAKQLSDATKALNDIKAKQEEADKESKRKKAEEDGKLKDLAKEQEAKIKELTDRLSSYEIKTQQTTEEMFGKLPKETQERIGVLKEKLNADDWGEYVAKEHEAWEKSQASDTDVDDVDNPEDDKPPGVSMGDDRGKDRGKKGRYRPKYRDLVEEHSGREMKWLDRTIEKTDPKTGARTFSLPTREFVSNLNIEKPIPLSREAAAARK